jgi:hypothetical protein
MSDKSTDLRGAIGSDVLKCIATHGTCSPYWGPSNLIWISQELWRQRAWREQAEELLRKCVTTGYSRHEINCFLAGQSPPDVEGGK